MQWIGASKGKPSTRTSWTERGGYRARQGFPGPAQYLTSLLAAAGFGG